MQVSVIGKDDPGAKGKTGNDGCRHWCRGHYFDCRGRGGSQKDWRITIGILIHINWSLILASITTIEFEC